MKLRIWFVALCVALFTSVAVRAQAPGAKKAPEKSAADLAGEAFYKIYNDKEAKLSQERFQKIIAAGIEYLAKNPTHWRANNVIRDLANFGGTITDKKLAAYRAAYVTQLKYELVNARYKDGVTDDGKAAFAALDAAATDFEMRDAMSKDNLTALREKIDTLAAMPGAGRFLADREISYFEIISRAQSPAAGEAHLKNLMKSTDKTLVARARTELNMVDARKGPYELKFTVLDGKEVDLAKLRGKVVVFAVWSGTGEGTANFLDAVKQAQSFKKKTVEVIGVSLDKEADREKVTKFLKDQKILWPVHYDGKEAKTEWLTKLNITKGPALVVFDKKGMFITNSLPTNQLETAMGKLSDAK